MSISDPANLFQRVPELRALSEDPKISRAIESGDPFKVYRSLVLARIFRRLPQHMPILRELTRERRLFAKPLKGTPSLATYNSVGFSFVGESERDSDGSHIALHAFVILFAIPLIPMGSYLVKSTGSRQWQIYARAPLGILGWLYTRGLALALVLLVLTGAAHSYHESNHQDLTILNGFEVPLTVKFDEKLVSVPAQGRQTVTLPVGQLHGVASAGKAGVIDTLDVKLESSDRYSIWNVAGAAPLVQNTVVYYKVRPSTPGNSGSQTVYCGKSFTEFSNIKYAFTEPPQTMSMGKYDSTTSVNQITVVSQPNVSGVNSCIGYTLEHSQEKDMAKALEAVAALKDWEEGAADVAIFAARSVSTKEAIRVARRALDARPDAVRLERGLQDLRDDAGEHDAMLNEYAARKTQHPDSGREQYLYASLLSGKDGLAKMAELAQQFPDDPNILRSLVWRKAAHGDDAGALRDLSRLHQLSPKDAAYLLEVEVRSLLTQGRGKEALTLLEASLSNSKARGYGEHAIEYFRVSKQVGGYAEKFLTKIPSEQGNDKTLDVYRTRAGLPLNAPVNAQLPAVKLSMALRDSPAQALTSLQEIDTAELWQLLGNDQIALLYSEAARVNDKFVQDKLKKFLSIRKNDIPVFDQYVRGENVSLENIDLDSDLLAAAYLVRSRNAQLPQQERNYLKQLAGKTDALQGIITTASKQWQS